MADEQARGGAEPAAAGATGPAAAGVTVTMEPASAAAAAWGRAVEGAPGEASAIPPSLYGRFEAFELLGRGGAGVVYRARDFRLGREVAVKLLFGADPERGAGLLREARSQAQLSHENVCEVYEAGVADHVRFIVMQLIEGAPLDRAKAEMTLEAKVRVVRQVASALHAAHQLGLVHRDVKPSNVMVERGEDGSWKPYIMDFGLAREAGDSGHTTTGAIAGTPSFMAPEQALGKVRSLDRRTDVYALGATLYDLIAGRPPFVAESVLGLLEKIRRDEAPPLRSADRDVPRDLEAIVMKCLEKQPGARYESARALGDDLQRFLDGDPVQARRGALYGALRRARRHRAKVALAVAALFATLLAAGLRLRARRAADEQATLARELGESVKEMELFLRNAHGMPLHDVERERDVVRGRLHEVEARMASAGRAGLGPGHYALGRGLLTLQEPEAALPHLERASAAGYRSPGLDYARGVALSALYKRALDETKRIQTASLRQARVATIEAHYKRPALELLRSALAGTIEAPAYVEGLIALYEGRLDEALAKAREASERAPWLYEAKKLEGDALFALGARHGPDAGAFDYEAMGRWFGLAAEAYGAAADLGRSDPSVHEAACELFTHAMNGAFEKGAPVRPGFEAAKAACGRAVAASSRSATAPVKLAWAHNMFAWYVTTGELAGEEPEAAIAEAVARAEGAVQRAPVDPFASYVEGAVWRTRTLHASNRGLDVAPAVDNAIAAYERSLRLDPGFLWALHELCSTLTMRGRREAQHGLDAGRTFDEAIARCDRALELDPEFSFPKASKIIALLASAEYLVESGGEPRAVIAAGLAAVAALEPQGSGARRAYWGSMLHRVEASYELASRGDAAPALERAEATAAEFEQMAPSSPRSYQLRGEAAFARARWLVAKGGDPSRSFREAAEALRSASQAKPWDLGYRTLGASVEIAALRWALRDGAHAAGVTEARFDAAFAPLLPLLDVARDDPSLYLSLAELHELRATFRVGRGRGDVGAEIAAGLARAEQALAINPRLAPALACQERLRRTGAALRAAR